MFKKLTNKEKKIFKVVISIVGVITAIVFFVVLVKFQVDDLLKIKPTNSDIIALIVLDGGLVLFSLKWLFFLRKEYREKKEREQKKLEQSLKIEKVVFISDKEFKEQINQELKKMVMVELKIHNIGLLCKSNKGILANEIEEIIKLNIMKENIIDKIKKITN